MEKQRVSNYDITRDRAEEQFLEYDQEKMIARYGMEHDTSYIYIDFLGHRYRISRSSGRIEWSSDDFETAVHADYNEALTIFDVLCYAKDDCSLSGEFVQVNDLEGVAKTASLGSYMYETRGKLMKNQAELLKTACEKLGGVPVKMPGDVACQIPMFPFLPVILQFWDADEEFDAVLKLMWDKNTLKYMHYETTYYGAMHLLKRLSEIMEEYKKNISKLK